MTNCVIIIIFFNWSREGGGGERAASDTKVTELYSRLLKTFKKPNDSMKEANI